MADTCGGWKIGRMVSEGQKLTPSRGKRTTELCVVENGSGGVAENNASTGGGPGTCSLKVAPAVQDGPGGPPVKLNPWLGNW